MLRGQMVCQPSQFPACGRLASLVLTWLLATIYSVALCRTATALEIDFPEIDPTYAIHVTADTVAEERQGAYQVLAFAGNCEIKQGTLTATAGEIVLWIERVSEKDIDHPGKTICYLNGKVVAKWGAERELRDHQWMVRLFSVHPVLHEAQPVKRYDIPSLDWSREASTVQLAQFMQTEGRSGAVLNAPPLLQPGGSSEQGTQPPGPTSAPGHSTPPVVPILPGAVEWNPKQQAGTSESTSNGPPALTGSLTAVPQSVAPPSGQANQSQSGISSPATAPSARSPSAGSPSARSPSAPAPSVTGNSLSPAANNTNLFPSGGLVIPDGGAAPYPAAGSRQAGPEEVPLPNAGGSPSFPQPEAQVVRQVPAPSPFNARTVQFLPRSRVNPQITISPFNPASGESVVQITGGFKMVAQGIQVTGSDGQVAEFGTVSLEADNAVVWLHGNGAANPLEGLSTSTPERPIELYLDGNIVFSQGNRVVYADRMYYNVSSEYGMVLSAEVLTPVPQYQGLLRLKADVIQQRDSRNFKAFGAAMTSSRLGVPRYWLQSGDLEFQDYRDETELSVFAPTEANRPTNMLATAKSNLVYVGGLPVFYWPTFSTNLKKPSFYLTGLRFANDDIFGFQTYADIDLLHLLGIQAPRGSDFNFSVDYLSERGPAFGTDFSYQSPTWLFGVPGQGYSNSWFIYDQGLDTLGTDRVDMVPEQEPWRGAVSLIIVYFCRPIGS